MRPRFKLLLVHPRSDGRGAAITPLAARQHHPVRRLCASETADGSLAGRGHLVLAGLGVLTAIYLSWQLTHWGGASNRLVIGDVFFFR